MITTIEPGQVLKDGDYFEGGLKYEYTHLLKIQNQTTLISEIDFFNSRNMVYNKQFHKLFLPVSGIVDPVTKYSFEAFRELCENTFGR